MKWVLKEGRGPHEFEGRVLLPPFPFPSNKDTIKGKLEDCN